MNSWLNGINQVRVQEWDYEILEIEQWGLGWPPGADFMALVENQRVFCFRPDDLDRGWMRGFAVSHRHGGS